MNQYYSMKLGDKNPLFEGLSVGKTGLGVNKNLTTGYCKNDPRVHSLTGSPHHDTPVPVHPHKNRSILVFEHFPKAV